MVVNIAINGLGRIGRLVLRNLGNHPNINLIAVNDLVSADNLAYLIKYDSTHGRFSGEVHAEHDCLVLNGKKIKVFNERELSHLSWKECGVDYVVEATGVFTTSETLSKHLEMGAKRVIVCAPAKGAIPTFVMGVNHKKYNPSTDLIVSNASCTTNCLALIAKVILDNFGFAEGLMTTVHAMTASQPSVDGVSKKDWRGGRGAHQNIIPASTGAAQAVTLCLPELKGKLTGMAFRVPVPDVSVVDLTVRVEKPATYQQICQKMMEAAEGEMKGFLEYCDEQLVSSDFISSPFSAIFDAKAGISLNGYFCKLVAWYDNEMGYASRVLDLIDYMAKREKEV